MVKIFDSNKVYTSRKGIARISQGFVANDLKTLEWVVNLGKDYKNTEQYKSLGYAPDCGYGMVVKGTEERPFHCIDDGEDNWKYFYYDDFYDDRVAYNNGKIVQACFGENGHEVWKDITTDEFFEKCVEEDRFIRVVHTLGELREMIKDIPDDYVLTYCGDDVGAEPATYIDVDVDKKLKRINIYIGEGE